MSNRGRIARAAISAGLAVNLAVAGAFPTIALADEQVEQGMPVEEGTPVEGQDTPVDEGEPGGEQGEPSEPSEPANDEPSDEPVDEGGEEQGEPVITVGSTDPVNIVDEDEEEEEEDIPTITVGSTDPVNIVEEDEEGEEDVPTITVGSTDPVNIVDEEEEEEAVPAITVGSATPATVVDEGKKGLTATRSLTSTPLNVQEDDEEEELLPVPGISMRYDAELDAFIQDEPYEVIPVTRDENGNPTGEWEGWDLPKPADLLPVPGISVRYDADLDAFIQDEPYLVTPVTRDADGNPTGEFEGWDLPKPTATLTATRGASKASKTLSVRSIFDDLLDPDEPVIDIFIDDDGQPLLPVPGISVRYDPTLDAFIQDEPYMVSYVTRDEDGNPTGEWEGWNLPKPTATNRGMSKASKTLEARSLFDDLLGPDEPVIDITIDDDPDDSSIPKAGIPSFDVNPGDIVEENEGGDIPKAGIPAYEVKPGDIVEENEGDDIPKAGLPSFDVNPGDIVEENDNPLDNLDYSGYISFIFWNDTDVDSSTRPRTVVYRLLANGIPVANINVPVVLAEGEPIRKLDSSYITILDERYMPEIPSINSKQQTYNGTTYSRIAALRRNGFVDDATYSLIEESGGEIRLLIHGLMKNIDGQPIVWDIEPDTDDLGAGVSIDSYQTERMRADTYGFLDGKGINSLFVINRKVVEELEEPEAPEEPEAVETPAPVVPATPTDTVEATPAPSQAAKVTPMELPQTGVLSHGVELLYTAIASLASAIFSLWKSREE